MCVCGSASVFGVSSQTQNENKEDPSETKNENIRITFVCHRPTTATPKCRLFCRWPFMRIDKNRPTRSFRFRCATFFRRLRFPADALCPNFDRGGKCIRQSGVRCGHWTAKTFPKQNRNPLDTCDAIVWGKKYERKPGDILRCDRL